MLIMNSLHYCKVILDSLSAAIDSDILAVHRLHTRELIYILETVYVENRIWTRSLALVVCMTVENVKN